MAADDDDFQQVVENQHAMGRSGLGGGSGCTDTASHDTGSSASGYAMAPIVLRKRPREIPKSVEPINSSPMNWGHTMVSPAPR